MASIAVVAPAAVGGAAILARRGRDNSARRTGVQRCGIPGYAVASAVHAVSNPRARARGRGVLAKLDLHTVRSGRRVHDAVRRVDGACACPADVVDHDRIVNDQLAIRGRARPRDLELPGGPDGAERETASAGHRNVRPLDRLPQGEGVGSDAPPENDVAIGLRSDVTLEDGLLHQAQPRALVVGGWVAPIAPT